MRPILFSLGSLNFYSYGFFTALGLVAGGVVIHYLAKKKKLLTSKHREYFLVDGLLLSFLISLVVARLSYLLLYSFILQVEPFELTANILKGGFIFYPGLVAGLGSFWWWLRRHEIPLLPWLDVVMIGILSGYTLVGLGGFLNDGQILHLGTVLGSLIILGVTYPFFISQKPSGNTFIIGLNLLFVLFFFLGFWRLEAVIWIGLSLSQWASLVGLLVFAGLVTTWRRVILKANK